MTGIRAIAAALLLLALTAAGTDGHAQGRCVSGRDGRQLLEEGRVTPFPEAMRRAGISSDQVVDVQLCRGGGGYVYRVRVLQPGGKVRRVNIPAG
jgi:hypothetical protein